MIAVVLDTDVASAILKGRLLAEVIAMLDELPDTEQDTKGDLGTAGSSSPPPST